MPQDAPLDPYHRWLGIPKHQQPPTHYRLLGIELYESNPDVIDAAASRQVAYLHQIAAGPNRRLTQRLMNEIARARRTLLDDQLRQRYDASLAQMETAQSLETAADSAENAAQSRENAAQSPSIPIPVIDTTPPTLAGKRVKSASAAKVRSGSKPDKPIFDASMFQMPTADSPVQSAQATGPSLETLNRRSETNNRTPESDNRSTESENRSTEAEIAASQSVVPSFDFSIIKTAPAANPASGSGGKLKTENRAPGLATTNKATTNKPTTNKATSKPQGVASPQAAPVADVGDNRPKAGQQAAPDAKQPKRTHSGKAAWWQRNDWRMHLSISAITLVLLVIILVVRSRNAAPYVPKGNFKQPSITNFDDKF